VTSCSKERGGGGAWRAGNRVEVAHQRRNAAAEMVASGGECGRALFPFGFSKGREGEREWGVEWKHRRGRSAVKPSVQGPPASTRGRRRHATATWRWPPTRGRSVRRARE
jgi:hypothetical protein